MRTGSVQGGVVFMAREVTGALMRWCYRTQEERDKLFECCLTLLHHTLEDSGLGESGRKGGLIYFLSFFHFFSDLYGCKKKIPSPQLPLILPFLLHTDPSVHTLVVRQLVDRSSAGRTLLSVVESGASLEGVLSLPTHSPASTQALRLTRTAQMALSILHRLVGCIYLYFFYSGVSSNAFGSNEFTSNDPFEALSHLQSYDSKFRSNGNYSGHPGSNFKLPDDC